MKAYGLGLQNSVVGSYDKTKTTINGRATQKTINSQLVIGPPLTQFVDFFTQQGIAPYAVSYDYANNRLFAITAIAAGVATLGLASLNSTTGALSFIGKLVVTFPNSAATTHTIRGFRVNSTGTTNWKIMVATTGSVLINGGIFYVNGAGLADFIPVGYATLPMATSSSQKAVYMLQDGTAMGSAVLNTAMAAIAYPFESGTAGINTKVYGHNGVAATHQYYVNDLSGTPSVAGTQTGATISVAAPGVVTTGSAHGFANNDPVIFTAGTVPTGLALNTVYFVGGTGGVNTATTFSVAATSGGAAITTTGSPGSGVTVMRAFGQCSSLFSFKTGNLPALAGTLLLTNSENYCVPTSVLSGQDCIFLCTTTNAYLGKLSELTVGATTWASLTTNTIVGTGSDITAPTPTYAAYSTELDAFVYITNTSAFVVHKMVNGSIVVSFGGNANLWLEGNSTPTVNVGLSAITCLEVRNGYMIVVGSTVGQRGAVVMDLYSDNMFGYSYLTSPVLIGNPGDVLHYISTVEQLFDYTDSMEFYYRTGASASDAVFTTQSGSWVNIKTAKDNNLALQGAVQFQIGFDIATYATTTPAQIYDLIASITQISELSNNWEGSVDNSSSNGSSPFYSAFRLQTAYATSVPTMYFRAYDDSGNLVASANTSANPTLFSYSTNNGTSWNSLGTIPNTPLTTELRYNWSSPPGVRTSVSLRES